MITSQNSFRVVAFPLLEHESDQDDDNVLVRSSSLSSEMHLHLNFWDLHQFWSMIEEPTKDDLTGRGMWEFAFGNAMLWWHAA
jgi:hypothetical protein